MTDQPPTKVEAVSHEGIAALSERLDQRVLRPTHLQVGRGQGHTSAVVWLRLEVERPPDMRSVPRDFYVALTPAAAAQLSRSLRKAVKEYLRHTPDSD